MQIYSNYTAARGKGKSSENKKKSKIKQKYFEIKCIYVFFLNPYFYNKPN